jgi:hypothetical protein
MPAFKDITGQRFFALVTTNYVGKSKWNCLCDCGQTTIVRVENLKSGNTKSCGCRKGIVLRARQTRHGHAPKGKPSKTYVAWYQMLQRCENPNNKRFADWGGRGITICEHWHIFENFLADMGESPPRLTLDRIDNNLGYFQGNCRWATHSEQNYNRRPKRTS